MLATILKSERATQTTIAIVETFTKIRELSRTVAAMSRAFAIRILHKCKIFSVSLCGQVRSIKRCAL